MDRSSAHTDSVYAEERGPRRRPLLRAVVLALLFVSALLLALTIGDASYHATATGWVPLVALVVLVALSWGYVCLCCHCVKLGIFQHAVECERGQEVLLGINVQNTSILPIFCVELCFEVCSMAGEAAHTSISTLTLAPRERAQANFAVNFEHVGRFSVGTKSVLVQDFLGLFYRYMSQPEACEVCVTPSLVSVAQLRMDAQSAEEVQRPQKAVLADSMDYAYVRPYAAGDPLKTIHWKLSARSERLQTRLYEQTVNPGVAVVLDFAVPDAAAESKLQLIDCVVESGLSIARYVQREGVEVEIHYIDKDGQLCQLSHWDSDMALAFVESMPTEFVGASAQARSSQLFQHVCGRGSRQPNVVVCSANLSDAVLAEVIQAKMARRTPLFVAAVPTLLVDKARERYLAPLHQLAGVGIASKAVSHSRELEGALL